jgi:small subunit ribosomal protein S1
MMDQNSKAWSQFTASHSEGDEVIGTAMRKIKGGLILDVGVAAFLPWSQIDVNRPMEIDRYIGQQIRCIILKIDESRRNVVVSRRAQIEGQAL